MLSFTGNSLYIWTATILKGNPDKSIPMSKQVLISFLILVLFLNGSLFAQQAPKEARFSNGKISISNNLLNQTFTRSSIAPALQGNQYFVALSFSTLPSAAQQAGLLRQGVRLEAFMPGNVFLGSVYENFDFSKALLSGLISIDLIPQELKIDRSVRGFMPSSDKQDVKLMAVSCFRSFDISQARNLITASGASIVSTKFDAGSNLVFVQADTSLARKIAAKPFVQYVSIRSLKDKALNYNTRAVNGVSGLNAVNGKNLNGKNVTIGIGDNADITTHLDLTGRVINRSPWFPEDHGTHVSGTTAGAGIINIKNRGMASRATIVSQFFSDILTNSPTYVNDYGMVLTNNSYYSGDNGCPGNSMYDEMSNYIDYQVRQYPELLHVVAAGNDGSQTCSGYPLSFSTIKSGWQTAKNVVTVGAMNTDDYTIAYFSSRGPVSDGRIKPEVTCNGWAVMSTNAYNVYNYNFGTSMASPGVTGSLALMYERYRQKNAGANPHAALMKALLCNTAEDLGNPGPDFTFGFGMINTRRAVEAIDSNRYFISNISNAGSNNHTITVPKNARRLKVMLYWADKEAAPNALTTLVNDLDITVATPSSAIHYPLVLNPQPGNVNDPAVEAADHLNNIEQVVIDNPVAGNYTVTISGYAVPFGPQEYVVAYEIQDSSVVVEYPCGGETLVPGETETIRWNAYGSENNTFAVSYSTDNGSSWTDINNAVPSTKRSLSWTVPATVTNTALVRVIRNGTALKDQSDFNFTIHRQPSVTATNLCEGAVNLSWRSIAQATSYDVFQLDADTMKLIGNTVDTFFVVKGLNKNTRYWFGAAAKNGSVAGRRSLSVSITPNSGACTQSAFNNDLVTDSILTPNTSRIGFSNAANATAAVKIRIRNLGTVQVNGPYDLSYQCDGGSATETVNTPIAPGGTLDYTFTTPFSGSSSGFRYRFKAWVTHTSDGNHLNDTAYKSVKLLNNDPVTLPYQQDFENFSPAQYTSVMGMDGLSGNDADRYDFRASTSKGRARTFVNTGMAHSGTKAITLDQQPFDVNTTVDSLVVSINAQSFSSQQSRLEFWYKNHGQDKQPGNKVWIRASENDAWVEAYDLYANQGAVNKWKHALVNINDVLGVLSPTSTFQIKFGEQGYTSTNSVTQDVDIDDGYSFDDLAIYSAQNDLGVSSILSPVTSGCSLTANTPVTVRLKNYNPFPLNNISVAYRINNGTVVNEAIPSIAANTSLDYTFSQLADFSAYADYTLDVWAKYATDNYASNDSILNYQLHNSPLISSYPYLEGFENNDGNFYSKGLNNSWKWGAPAKTIISGAANGTKAWVTGLTGNYRNNENSYLYSPCFDLTSLTNPVLSFSHIFDIEKDYDYTWVEYSTDGINWQKLGAKGSGTNWYDNGGTEQNWRLSLKKWHVASIDLPPGIPYLRIRFVLSSDGGVTMEGVGIDDFRIHEKAAIAVFPPVTSATVNNISSTGWTQVRYTDPGSGNVYLLAEINPNGQSLGNVSVDLYPNNTGNVRVAGNQFYLDRNYVIHTAIAPTAPVGVRLYFTDAESEKLSGALGCNSCVKPTSAYALGITKYRWLSEENGNLEDDLTGLFKFITPSKTQIIPHGNGYYAEFMVDDFSECWFSADTLVPISVSNCGGGKVTYRAAAGGTDYQWQEDTGSGFADISDDANHSGSGTHTLQLVGMPTSSTGYRYRCMIDGVPDFVRVLRFVNSWTGNNGTNWFTPQNWGCGVVPDQYTDVIIPTGRDNYPVINNNAAVRSLRANPSSPVIVSPGILFDIRGN